MSAKASLVESQWISYINFLSLPFSLHSFPSMFLSCCIDFRSFPFYLSLITFRFRFICIDVLSFPFHLHSCRLAFLSSCITMSSRFPLILHSFPPSPLFPNFGWNIAPPEISIVLAEDLDWNNAPVRGHLHMLVQANPGRLHLVASMDTGYSGDSFSQVEGNKSRP